MNENTLILTRDFQPLSVVDWRRAVTLVFEGKARIVEVHDRYIGHATLDMRVPSVVSLTKPFRRPRKPAKFSRVNVYARDGFQCQYCGERKKTSELTYDHVIPRSRGGQTVWTNIVSCCSTCNEWKGGRTPEQAGMHLLKKPTQPVDVPEINVEIHDPPEQWRPYLRAVE
jgi:5-methylcytosine-specific restriction endonuclease McrA